MRYLFIDLRLARTVTDRDRPELSNQITKYIKEMNWLNVFDTDYESEMKRIGRNFDSFVKRNNLLY